VPNMTDQGRINWFLQAVFTASATATFTPGTGGGSPIVITPPYHLRLMTAQGTNTAGSNGTEMPTEYGYTSGSVTSNSLGATFCAAPSAGTQSNSNVVTWTATGTWPTITAIEVWDAAGTPLRWLQGALTSSITSGDSVQFAAASITINASAW